MRNSAVKMAAWLNDEIIMALRCDVCVCVWGGDKKIHKIFVRNDNRCEEIYSAVI